MKTRSRLLLNARVRLWSAVFGFTHWLHLNAGVWAMHANQRQTKALVAELNNGRTNELIYR